MYPTNSFNSLADIQNLIYITKHCNAYKELIIEHAIDISYAKGG